MNIQAAPVNRVIRVNQNRHDINVRRVDRNVSVNTVGRRGPQGENGIVNHGVIADTARPNVVTPVIWIGAVEPTNAQDYDLWINVA